MAVVDSYIPIFPMWSGVMLWAVEGISRDSNATIENWFRTVKENVLQGRKRLAPGNFIRQVHKVIKGRVREYEATMKPVLRKKGSQLLSTENIELYEETWKRKEKTNLNSSYYCTPEKIPEPKVTKVLPVKNNGIENKGNDCWLISTVQSLKVCKSIAVDSKCLIDDTVEDNTLLLIKELRKCTRKKKVYTVDSILDRFSSNEELRCLDRTQQHDPCQFLSFFLRSNLMATFNPTIIRYSKRCLRCNFQTSKAAEEVCILPLAMIPVEIEPTIQDLVNEYFKAEALVGDDSVFCDLCENKTPQERFTALIGCPSTLILQLNRFNNNLQKLSNKIHINRFLRLPGSDDQKPHDYVLRGVQIHKGHLLMNGHYYTITIEESQIVEYDDQKVSVRSGDVLDDIFVQENCYILYYDEICSQNAIAKNEKSLLDFEGTIGREALTKEDLNTLEGCNWLNDKVINEYFGLLQRANKQIYAFTSFFREKLHRKEAISIDKWVPKDLSNYRYLLFPLHLKDHWIICIGNMEEKIWNIYDPLHRTRGTETKCIGDFLEMKTETKWRSFQSKRLPKQKNSYDCGAYICKYARQLTCGGSLQFTQADIKRFRTDVQKDIVGGSIFLRSY